MLFMKAIFPGSDTRPTRSGTWILDLSHHQIWAIWLAEVRKFHQHPDRISNTIHCILWDGIPYSCPNVDCGLVFYTTGHQESQWSANGDTSLESWMHDKAETGLDEYINVNKIRSSPNTQPSYRLLYRSLWRHCTCRQTLWRGNEAWKCGVRPGS